MPEQPGRAVLVIRVAESPDAPHEVRHGPSPEVLVRRRDNTESAGIDDVERLIRRRDAARGSDSDKVGIEFFEERIALPGIHRPPVAAVWTRPRMAASLRFGFDHRFDEQMRLLFLQNEIGHTVRVRPFSGGLGLDGVDDGAVVSRVEVGTASTIRGARALREQASTRETFPDQESGEVFDAASLDFDEVASAVVSMTRFAVAAYATRKSAVEVEVFFGLHRCQGFWVKIPTDTSSSAPRSYTGRVPGNPLGHSPTYGGAMLRTDAGEPVEEDLMGLVRELSRAVGISTPDARLQDYLS